MMELTKRLQAVADLVPTGLKVADVGCDHGYVSIYLMENKIATKVIAMDVNVGPLEMAKKHIVQYGFQEFIETRLSDGVSALLVGEVDCIVVAGMGGKLMWRILEDHMDVIKAMKYLVLQPQSEIPLFREKLREQGFLIEAENMIFEDGKYYPMMRVKVLSEDELSFDNRIVSKEEASKELIRPEYNLYGEHLLKSKNQCLFDFLQFEQRHYEDILTGLKQDSKRAEEVRDILKANKEAQQYFGL